MSRINYYRLQPAEQINEALDTLPTAELWDVHTSQPGAGTPVQNLPGWKAVAVTRKGKTSVVHVPTKQYVVVQHKDAFRPIIEGLTQAGVSDFRFIMVERDNKAEMQIYVGEPGHDTVQLGLRCYNSYDGSSAAHYGFKLKRVQKELVVELCAYRQVCSNGMRLYVPLRTPEAVAAAKKAGELLSTRERTVTKESELYGRTTSIRHTKNAVQRIEEMQYVVEALALLQNPLEEYVKSLQKVHFTDSKAVEKIINKHVGTRYRERIMAAYSNEPGDTLWDLFNAVTWVASHDSRLPETAREGLLNRASRMPMAVINGGDEE